MFAVYVKTLGKTHIKKVFFFSVQTTKRGPLSKKPLLSINGENSPGSCIMKILFCEVRHFSPNFHKCTPNFVAWTTKPLGGGG